MFIGNIFVYFQFQGLTHIDEATRSVVIWVLSGIAIVGIVILVLLRKAVGVDGEVVVEEHRGPLQALRDALRLLITKRMLLLSICFYYTGTQIISPYFLA